MILRAFMAITAHYLLRDENNRLILKARLLAFRYLPGHHTGNNLADAFFAVLKEEGIVDKVSVSPTTSLYQTLPVICGIENPSTCQIGTITMDNASNNQTKMEGLEILIHNFDPMLEFDPEGNRARYGQHTFNTIQTNFILRS